MHSKSNVFQQPVKALFLVYTQNLLVLITLNAGRVMMSLYALDIGATVSDVGVIIALMYVYSLLLSWPAAVLADRYGSSWMLAIGSAVGTGAMLAPVFWHTLPSLWIGTSGIGIAFAFSNVLTQNLVGVLSSPRRRTQNFSNYSLMSSLAGFIGPLLAGISIDYAGFVSTSVFIVILLGIATLFMLVWGGMLPAGERRSSQGGNLLATLAEPGMSRILIVSSLAMIGFDFFNSFMPVYAHGAGLSASVIGTALSAFAVASFLARIVMTRLIAARSEETVLAAGFVFGAAAFFLLPAFETALALSVISFIFGLFAGFSAPITMMMVFAASTEGRSGEALGLRLTVNNFTRVIGPALFGATSSALGLGPLFIASGALMCIGGFMSQQLKRR